jgi:hypothetical protein
MWKFLLAVACLLAGCATANSLDDAALRADRVAEAHALVGNGAASADLQHEADSYRARAEIIRLHPTSRMWADATLH